jgi:hypothetical protein
MIILGRPFYKILDRRYMFLATRHGHLRVLPLVVPGVDEDLVGDLKEPGAKEMGWWTVWSLGFILVCNP